VSFVFEVSDVFAQFSAYSLSLFHAVLMECDVDRLPSRLYKIAQSERGLIMLLTAKRLHPHDFLEHRLIPYQSGDLWHATTNAANLDARQNSTSHPFRLHQLSRRPHGISRKVTEIKPHDSLLEFLVLFLNVSMTVVGLICRTQAISRIPPPFMVISTICCVTSGSLP
jgi:hypothetical protein